MIDGQGPLSWGSKAAGAQQLVLGRTLPPGFIQVGAATEIALTLRDLGVDPQPIIRKAGLDPSAFDDEANVIPHAGLGRLLTLSVARTNFPHFGLLVGRRSTILSLGMVGRLMLHSETLGHALQGLVTNSGVQNRGAVPSLATRGDMAEFTYAVYQPSTESAEQMSDIALAVAVNAIRKLSGSAWSPSEVLLPRAAPPDCEPYRQHFKAPVRFNQETATLIFPAVDLEISIAGADPLLRAMIEEQIRKMKRNQSSEFADDVRRLLRVRLTGKAEHIADLLTMNRRTLSRRLRCTGTAYNVIANEVRFETARQLLQDTNVPLSQIAAALGYSEASAFCRAFKRWSGKTPASWRAEGQVRELG
jgi:AraC-like DNA-binding protein